MDEEIIDDEVIPVIFRRFKDGNKEVIALFPTLVSDIEGRYCESYMHVGQHGGATTLLVYDTKPASLDEEDVKELYEELTSEPYNYKLRVMRRITRQMEDERRREAQRLREWTPPHE